MTSDDRVGIAPRLSALGLITAAAMVALGAPPSASRALAQRPPDTVLVNAHIITVDEGFTSAEAVAILDDRILAVGSTAEIQGLAGPATRAIDLAGRTVIPGLADDHLHTVGGGPGVDLSNARSLQDVLQAIAARAERLGSGALVVTNSDWHEAQLVEHRLPLRRDLDRAAPVNPVVVVRGGHEYILNSLALERWGIDESTAEPEGGRITRYPDGALNGEIVNAAKALVGLPPAPEPTLAERIEQQREEYRVLNAAGLTSVRHPGVSIPQYRTLREMRRRGLLTMRVNALLRPPVGAGPDAIAAWLADLDLLPDEGDAWLRIGGVKLGVDGGFEGGLMREPYAEPFGQGGVYRGLQLIGPERLAGVVRALNREGWRVATHAVGDAAIDLVLGAYQAANDEASIAGRRWSIEHAFIPRDDQFPRMRALGLVISAQHHLFLAGPSLERYWGRERAERTTPLRTYLDEGLPVAIGTDAAVVPYPPLGAIYHFVTRDTITGGVFGADQRISRAEAIRAATMGNAFLTFDEQVKGSIESGKLADLVVLSGDIMTCPEDQIDDLEVLLTMVGGRIVFEDPALGLP